MNRFRARRKAKEQQQAESHLDAESFLQSSFASKGFGMNKKTSSETKPNLDLSTALPSTNDFRTSLIMPNLSARFSMLREQDDPSTKIGKANDDSVLFPKRASRLNLFSHNPLTDIAEVSSLHDSIKPPFAFAEPSHSFDADGYESDGGSMMNRSRPGEGNNLFGGRQKLYKIPVETSSKTRNGSDASQPDSTGMPGRVMYENDVSLSLFQKHREKEREEHKIRNQRDSLDGAEEDSPHSPATSFSKDRGTTSSTTSVPRRNSTAATSLESQSPSLYHNNGSASSLSSPPSATNTKPAVDRNATVYRKMYGQALNQSSTIQRVAKDVFDNLSRPRAATNDRNAKVVSPGRVTPTVNDNSPRPGPSPPPTNFRSASPTPFAAPSVMGALDSALRNRRPSEASQGQTYGYARPLSPPVSDGEDATTFANSLQPEDRGKATAMGLFNKPRKYDEQQFSQRQVQMHQGRNSPAPHRAFSPTPVSTPASSDERRSDKKRDHNTDEKDTIVKDARARAASLIRHQNEELAALEAQRTGGSQKSTPRLEDAHKSTMFLDDDDDTASKADTVSPAKPSIEISDSVHPAFRPVIEGFQFPPFDSPSTKVHSTANASPFGSSNQDQSKDVDDSDDFNPIMEGLGLSGLIRTHLRHDSDKSSIYPPASPRIPQAFTAESPTIGTASPAIQHVEEPPPLAYATNAQFKMAQNAKQFLNNATLLKNRANNRTQQPAGNDRSETAKASPNAPNWQDELQSRHHRGGSTETQQEREAFNNELAERRRRVQETLKNSVESQSRSASPLIPPEPSPAKSGMGLSAMLRSKSSHTKFNNPQPEHSSKAMKVLGLGPGPGSSPSLSSPKPPQDDLWKEEEERMLEDFARKPKAKQFFGQSPTRTFPRAPPEPIASKPSDSDADRSRQRSATPASMRSSARDRSTSDVSGRSKSRNGRYRDDLEKAMAEGAGSQARMYGLPNSSSVSMQARPSVEVTEQPERSASAMSGRYRSNSRANTPGYFESKSLNPLQTSGMPPASLSARPSPRTPYSANSTPPIRETSASPAISNASTTTLTHHQPIPQPPPSTTDGRTTPLTTSLRGRKRSVTKNMISDPTFISTTYNVSTVDLPPGASLRNGSPDNYHRDTSSPPIPFMNPNRRRGRIGTGNSATNTLLSTLTGRNANDSKSDLLANSAPHTAIPTTSSAIIEERSTFSDEGEDKDRRPAPLRPRAKLRKVSSEAGDMSGRARYQALMAGPSPALPTFPVKRGPSPTMAMHSQRAGPVEGGMF
jgi:hypothetical protein